MAMIRILKIFGTFFAAILAISAVVFPFTLQKGLHGYAFIVMCTSGIVTAIGGLIVYGSGGTRPPTPEFDQLSYLDPATTEEIRKDLNRGSTLGTELFYIGGACIGLGYLLYRMVA
ncbi:MAG: hypothetical protein JWM68_3076 [Verrucomicrobiales bacterium]|nr:hypothetical protein [Verrucomicrobiales bacterium]